MANKTKEILQRLSRGEITPEEAERELAKLQTDKEGGLLRSICHSLANLDICLDFGGNRFTLEEEFTGALEQGPVELDLSASNGSIRVEGWDGDGYRLVVKKRVRAASQEEAEELAARYTFAEIQGNSIKAGDPDCRQARRNIAVSLHLQLPANNICQGKIGTANGSITISDLTCGDIQVRSVNGSITLDSLQGKGIAATTVNGSIRIQGKLEQVKAGTTNGSIRLAHSGSGNHSLKTVNGSIRAAVAGQDIGLAINAKTVAGKVKVNHPQLSDIKEMKGFGSRSIQVRSANYQQAATKVDLELQTVNGSIHVREHNDDDTHVDI